MSQPISRRSDESSGEPSRGPGLTRYDVPGQARALALVLHGGKDRSAAPVTGRSLSWRRAQGLARALARPLADEARRCLGAALPHRRAGTATAPARSRTPAGRWTGWGPSSVSVPVVLVGHSMGGRTACQVADHDLVRGVVALAPWLPPTDPVTALTGRELHAAHGRRDHITRPRDTRAYVERPASVTTAASYTDMGDRGHYLLRGVHAWNAFTLDRVRRVLDPEASG